MSEQSQRTPLYEEHQKLGGKLVNFAGWELPVRYSSIIEEHNAVRTAAGLFDVSHMGEILVSGKDSVAFLNYVTCNDVAKLVDGKAHYNALINEKGGVVDDLIIYRFSENEYFICANAANVDKDFAYLTQHASKFDVRLENQSAEFAQIALQGPKAQEILSKLFDSAKEVKTFHFAKVDFAGTEAMIARTGYTGEDGFEIFVTPDMAAKLWSELLAVGEPFGLAPCGLGARDSLRLEACYPLHGHELSDDITAIESGLGWIVKLKKGDFIGKSILEQQKKEGAPRKLVAFIVEDQGIVREGAEVFDNADNRIGIATSGTMSPTLDKAVGMLLVNTESAKEGDTVFADVRGKKKRCTIASLPLYKKP